MHPVQIFSLVTRLAQWEAASFALETNDFTVTVTRQAGVMRLQFDGARGGRLIASVYATRAALTPNLIAEANALALVISQDADRGIYVKSQGIGFGSWSKSALPLGDGLRTILQALLDGLASGGGGGSGGTDLTPVYSDIAILRGEVVEARSLPGLWTYPGNGNNNAALATNQTTFPVPGGYTPGFVRVRIGLAYIKKFTATDGQNVVLTGGYPFGADDVVEIEILKANAVANAASKATVDALTARLDALAPDNSGWTVS